MSWRLIASSIMLTLIMGFIQMTVDASGSQSNMVSRVNAVWYDWRFRLWPPQREPLVPIVIVDIDEASLQREGRWPWDRAKVGQLLDVIASHGALLTGLDVVFSEGSPNPVETLLHAGRLSSDARKELEPMADDFDSDAQLAETLAEQSVLGYFFHRDGFSVGELPPALVELPPDSPDAGLLNMPDYTANLPILAEHALASGFIVAVPDADGVMRRMPLLIQHANGIYSALSLEMARILLNAPWLRVLRADDSQGTVTGVAIGRAATISFDSDASILVPYKGGARSYPTISATRLLQDDASAEEVAPLAGAVVLVGTSALGLADLRTTPLQTGYPGVETHANILDALLQTAIQQHELNTSDTTWIDVWSHPSPIYHQPDWAPGADLLLLLGAGIFLAFLLPTRTPVTMMVRITIVLGTLVVLNIVLWHVLHLSLPLALQVLTVILVGSLNLVAGYLQTTQQKLRIQQLFGEYVPPQHVQRMLQDPHALSLEGEQREMTVLFADVRDFTAMSESLTAAELKSLLNRYLSAITKVIFDHQGTIDKYVGDLVMAFWNAPLNDPAHAKNAVAAALAMQARMQSLREEFEAEGLPQLRVGIGLNTGLMNVGDMGSSYRRAYTVLGDAVNLASRLESLTAYYGVAILVSDTTREAASGFQYCDIDHVRVKGRRAPLHISEPLPQDLSGQTQAQVTAFEAALAAYRQGDLKAAQEGFERLVQTNPDCRLYRLYLERTQTAATGSPEKDPVHTHEAK